MSFSDPLMSMVLTACTGPSRLPSGGFHAPEDNRGQLLSLTGAGRRIVPELGSIADRNDRTSRELTVKSRLNQGSEIEISVNDTGPGLYPEKADQIIDAFFTTKSRPRHGPGHQQVDRRSAWRPDLGQR